MKKVYLVIIALVLACFLLVSLAYSEDFPDNSSAGNESNLSVNVTSVDYNLSEGSKDGNLSTTDKKVCPDDGWYNSSEPAWVNISECSAELRQDIEYRVYENNPPHCDYNITATNYSLLAYLNNDSDSDGVCDYNDFCQGTSLWYAEVELNPNHFDSSNWNANQACGCNCKQILDLKPGEDEGEYDYGCTPGTRNVWGTTIGWAEGFCRGDLLSWLLHPSGISNQPQNITFAVNAIARCFIPDCGIVSGTLFYNGSSTYPGDSISTTFAKPFYVIGENAKSCGQMNFGDMCNLTWIVNATGDTGESYKINAVFDSKNKKVNSGTTYYAIIKIIAPALSIILSNDLMNVKFGYDLAPGSANNPAVNNTNNGYGVLCDYSAGRCNVSIRANSDMVSGGNSFGIGNVSWWRTNDFSLKKRFSFNYDVLNETLPDQEKQPIYLWLDIPFGQVSGNYGSDFTIQGLPN